MAIVESNLEEVMTEEMLEKGYKLLAEVCMEMLEAQEQQQNAD